jgi:hypothetical protein
MMSITRKNTLELVNEVLSRSGQKPISTLNAVTTPVRQALSFINQVYEELRFTMALPSQMDERQLPYTPTQFRFELATLDIHSAMVKTDTVWIRPVGETTWVSLRYEPELRLRPVEETSPHPTYFYFDKEVLCLAPTPKTTGTLRFLAEAPLGWLEAATDVPNLPFGSEYLLILGAVAYLQHFLGDTQSSALNFKLFEEGLIRLKKKYQPLFNALRMKNNRPGARQPE